MFNAGKLDLVLMIYSNKLLNIIELFFFMTQLFWRSLYPTGLFFVGEGEEGLWRAIPIPWLRG